MPAPVPRALGRNSRYAMRQEPLPQLPRSTSKPRPDRESGFKSLSTRPRRVGGDSISPRGSAGRAPERLVAAILLWTPLAKLRNWWAPTMPWPPLPRLATVMPMAGARQPGDSDPDLVRRGKPIVEHVSARVSSKFPVFTPNELASYGHEGLLEAALRYDRKAPTPFEAYARFRIRGAIMDGIRRELPQIQGLGSGFRAAGELFAEAPEAVSVFAEDAVARAQLDEMADGHLASCFAAYSAAAARGSESDLARRGAVSQAVAVLEEVMMELEERDRELVRLHYFEERDLGSVAEALNISYRTAKRVHASALGRLARALRRRGIAEVP
ncbi:MAG: sigma-70 family RNA polymerase sigma factor [Polyangiaceae bacterium]